MAEGEQPALAWLRSRLGRVRLPWRAAAVEALPAIAVVTDSAAALPPEWASAFAADRRLTVVPMPVMVGEEIFGEGEDDIGETISLALAAGKPVRTSRPSPGQFEAAYRAAEAAGFAGIVSAHLSADLSGTVEAARLAASRVGIPVEVVDTRTVGMAQGFGVQAAVLAAAAGMGLDDVARLCRRQADATKVLFYVPSLEQLRRGGRVGAAASWIGTVFAIKPILAVEGGIVVPLERVRTVPRAVARLKELAAERLAQLPPERARLAVHHFGNQPQAQELLDELVAAGPSGVEAQLSRLPAVLAAHAGLGVLVVVTAEAVLPGD